MRNKDREFEKILIDLSFKGDTHEPEFTKMQSIIDTLYTVSRDEFTFNNNIEEIRKLLYTLSSHVFCLKYTMKNIGAVKIPDIPGCHDFNVGLSKTYFDYWMYKEFYKLFIEDIKPLIATKGDLYPRFIHEIVVLKNKYRVNLKVLLFREDMPEKSEFDVCDYGRYFTYHKNLLSLRDHINKYNEIFDNIESDSPEEYIELRKMAIDEIKRNYPLLKELSNNIDYYKNLSPVRVVFI